MSNINSTETVRTIVADNPTAGRSQAAPTARVQSESGNDLPPTTLERDRRETQTAQRQVQRTEAAVQQLNDYVQSFQRDLEFSLDETSGRSVVRVVDTSTQELIRQIPNDVALRLARNLKENLQTYLQTELQTQAISELNTPKSGAGSSASLGLINTRI